MNIIQKLRNLIFGENEVVKAPAPVVVEALAPVEVKPTVQELITSQEEPLPKPKPKRKYYKKKKSTGESK
jgi:cell division septation protein DedD